MEVAKALRETEAVILKFGWKKKGFGSPTDGFCLLGALRHVILGTTGKNIHFTDDQWDVFHRAVVALHKAMIEEYPKDASKSVAMWNDMDRRTEKQILKLLRSAIAAATKTP